ncbi:hypothetical protein HED54_23020 [Ochrobactrum anthropi ATCC 49188]|nr:hypothetical protein [Brucella anthropi ATCC 49188]
MTRHRNELVIQRSDIELTPQNITRMRNGQAPFVRTANGSWEPIQLHHVGRETGKMIEVTRSQNRYNSATGTLTHSGAGRSCAPARVLSVILAAEIPRFCKLRADYAVGEHYDYRT